MPCLDKFHPKLYQFEIPEEMDGCNVIVPEWALVDHLIAVVWHLVKNPDAKLPGMSHLLWAAEFLRTLKDPSMEYKNIDETLQKIEEKLTNRCAELNQSNEPPGIATKVHKTVVIEEQHNKMNKEKSAIERKQMDKSSTQIAQKESEAIQRSSGSQTGSEDCMLHSKKRMKRNGQTSSGSIIYRNVETSDDEDVVAKHSAIKCKCKREKVKRSKDSLNKKRKTKTLDAHSSGLDIHITRSIKNASQGSNQLQSARSRKMTSSRETVCCRHLKSCNSNYSGTENEATSSHDDLSSESKYTVRSTPGSFRIRLDETRSGTLRGTIPDLPNASLRRSQTRVVKIKRKCSQSGGKGMDESKYLLLCDPNGLFSDSDEPKLRKALQKLCMAKSKRQRKERKKRKSHEQLRKTGEDAGKAVRGKRSRTAVDGKVGGSYQGRNKERVIQIYTLQTNSNARMHWSFENSIESSSSDSSQADEIPAVFNANKAGSSSAVEKSAQIVQITDSDP